MEFKSVHVLMLSWAFSPRNNGTIAANVYNLSQRLKVTADVHVVTCGHANEPAEEVFDGVRVTRIDGSSLPQRDFLMQLYRVNSLMIEKAAKLIEKEGPFDIIHAHDWLVSRAAVEIKHRFNLPLVTTVHPAEPEARDWKAAMGVHQNNVHYIEQQLLHSSDRVVCCSSYMQGEVANGFGLPSDKMADVIPAGIDPAHFELSIPSCFHGEAAGSRNSEVPDWKKTILYAGRLTLEKGVHILVDAMARLRRDGTDVELVIAGDGPYRENLMEQVYARGLQKHVHFMGSVDHAMLVTLYRLSDVAAVPSIYEPFGIAVLEAMAGACPVVASDVGGISDIIEDGITGLKVQPGDSSALAAFLRRVLEDDSLAESLLTNARRAVAEKYSWALVAERTMEVYKNLVNAPGMSVMPASPPKQDSGISA
jgi:glycosyltransferase involved in cell wall biosynthesis